MYRLVRSVVVSGARNELYVDAAKVVGLSDRGSSGVTCSRPFARPVIVQSAFVLATGSRHPRPASTSSASATPPDLVGPRAAGRVQQHLHEPGEPHLAGTGDQLTILSSVLLGNALRDTLQASNRSAALTPARRKAHVRAARARTRRRDVHDLTPPQDVILSVRGLRIGYPTSATEVREVVHGVDLDVRRGEIHGLVGESGSGKSQIAFSTLGILPARGGHHRRQCVLRRPRPARRPGAHAQGARAPDRATSRKSRCRTSTRPSPSARS